MTATRGKDPAFPADDNWTESGMTLRDYFAGQAIAALLPRADTVEKRRGNDGVQSRATDYAQIAYFVADAMLAERERSQS